MTQLRSMLGFSPHHHMSAIKSLRRFHAHHMPHCAVGKLRNIGIIAHIDAGKTTVTERLLYLTGLTHTIGDVDAGNTVTDFMELERERGITIQSAAVSSMWRDHRLNLIDTPGHVDFTLEVERCLRVLDGAVTVIDASAGVQAQTLTVWRQASKFQLPSVFFVNKMDKPAADFQRSLHSIETRLDLEVVPVVVPLYDPRSKKLVALVDLLRKRYLDVRLPDAHDVHGETAQWEPLSCGRIGSSAEAKERHHEGWEELVSRVADMDEAFQARLLSVPNSLDIDAQEVASALRRLNLDRRLSPVACGSALRNRWAVEPVLDMVLNFLPSPPERKYALPDTDLCALVFKIGHDDKRGRLAYIRLYKGTLRGGTPLLNTNCNQKEVGYRLFTPFSNLLHPADAVEEGNIAVVSGLLQTKTGDTLVNNSATVKRTPAEVHAMSLGGISPPDPVFFCSVEPPSTASNKDFEEALQELCVEDPSLRVRDDDETGQTILEGMGELHIEVAKERLRREYDLNVFMGRLRVGYVEVLNKSVEQFNLIEDQFGEQAKRQWCRIRLLLLPTGTFERFTHVRVDIEDLDERNAKLIHPDWLKAINQGCRNALFNGPLLRMPVCGMNVVVRSCVTSGRRPNLALLNACASRCMKEALLKADLSLAEPIMRCEVTLISDERGLSPYETVLHEFAKRRADVLEIKPESDGHLVMVRVKLPLSESRGVANKMRSITSGLCSLHMELLDYEKLIKEEQQRVIDAELHRGESTLGAP